MIKYSEANDAWVKAALAEASKLPTFELIPNGFRNPMALRISSILLARDLYKACPILAKLHDKAGAQ